jgi:trehalose synthase
MAAFLRRIDLEDHLMERRESLHQQEKNTLLRPYILSLRREFMLHREDLLRVRVWMISSTARGGGVAEMLPRIMALMREMGMFVSFDSACTLFFRACVHRPGRVPCHA